MKKRISVFIVALTFMVGAFFMPQNVKAVDNGIDVYEHTTITSLSAIKNSGIRTILQKASEGSTYNDSKLNTNAVSFRTAGFKVGYYHFATNNGDVAGQANHFINQIKGLKSDTVYFLDIENEGTFKKATAIDFVNKFNNILKSKNYKMGIYTGYSFYNDYLKGNIDSSIPLWLASYGKQPSEYPSKASWQYIDKGYTPGINGNSDKDYFIGNIYLTNKTVPNLVKPQTTYSSIVYKVQGQLNRSMNSKLTQDGILNQKTIEAVANFQNVEGITITGNPDTLTQQCLNMILNFTVCRQGLGNWGAVKYIQYRLGAPIDGAYGSQTAKYVADYQLAHGLVSDGICGQNTWKQLFK